MRTQPWIPSPRQAAALAALVLCCTSGCMTGFREYFANGLKVGPNYCPPQAPASEMWIDYQKPSALGPDGQKLISIEQPRHWAWWHDAFNDPVLDDLVLTASRQNLTLRDAGYRIENARALRGISIGNLLPQSQTVSGEYRRQMLSFGTNITAGGAGGIPGVERYQSVYAMGGQLAWELDFWGRYRRAVEAANGALDASIENYDDVLVLLIADVAAAYVEIRTVEQRLNYARKNVIAQTQSRDLAVTRRDGGNATQLDVSQAQTNLSQTESTIPLLEIQLRQAQNRLCVLMGMPPYDLNPRLAETRGVPKAPPVIALGIPADLIRRRPDVRRAEREVAAQSARIGIAEADLYPAFSLTGQVFSRANRFEDLFNSAAVGGTFGPSFNWQVFNYFRIRNNVAAQEALFMQEVAQYQQEVLIAHQETEDALVSFLLTHQQRRHLLESVKAAEQTRDLLLFSRDVIDFNRVFVADLTVQQQQDNLAQVEGQIALSLVEVYRALGGGWEIRLEDPPRDYHPFAEEIGPGVLLRDPQMEGLPPPPEPEKEPAPGANEK